MTLTDTVSLVSEAARGIGRATAVRLASDGAHVVCADFQDVSMVAYFFREGAFLTGLTYPVDGGWSSKGNF